MSKYIRTEDGVYELISDLNNKGYNVKVNHYGTYHLIPKSTITAQADTIEELCDEAIVIEQWRDKPFVPLVGGNGTPLGCARELYLPQGCIIYGAVWVDGSLIKVAKMNKKGCLELL